MNNIISKISEIEASAASIMEAAAQRKKDYARETEEKKAAFDRELEAQTDAELGRLRAAMEEEAQKQLDAQRREAEALGLTLEDYFQREEFTVANAALTAEGAVQTAMERLEKTLLQMDCLVLGFGRIGKLLSCRLHGLGAHVTVAARSSVDRAWARAYGWEALDTSALEGRLCSFSAVFNTVPAMVLDASLLCQLPRSCLLVDLASQPGIDSDAASELGIPHVWARGLPGKLTPVAAASALRDAVYYILMEG